MGAGVEVKVIFTTPEYNRLLRATVESGKKLPRTFIIKATNEAVEKFLATPTLEPTQVMKAVSEKVDMSHLVSDAGPEATPSAGSSA